MEELEMGEKSGVGTKMSQARRTTIVARKAVWRRASGQGQGEVGGLAAEFAGLRERGVGGGEGAEGHAQPAAAGDGAGGGGAAGGGAGPVRQVAGQQLECLDMAEVERLIAAQKAVLAEVAQPNVVTGHAADHGA